MFRVATQRGDRLLDAVGCLERLHGQRLSDFAARLADGSITLGGAVAGVLLVAQVHPLVATAAAFAAGALAGTATGMLHTRFKINGLLSGILVMTALYSINLHVMGKSNLPLLSERTLVSHALTPPSGLQEAQYSTRRLRFACVSGSSRTRASATCAPDERTMTGLRSSS